MRKVKGLKGMYWNLGYFLEKAENWIGSIQSTSTHTFQSLNASSISHLNLFLITGFNPFFSPLLKLSCYDTALLMSLPCSKIFTPKNKVQWSCTLFAPPICSVFSVDFLLSVCSHLLTIHHFRCFEHNPVFIPLLTLYHVTGSFRLPCSSVCLLLHHVF